MNYSTQQIADSIDGTLHGKPNEHIIITDVLTDSRRLTHPSSTVFFAIKTQKQNAHLFINELYEKGVRCFVITEPTDYLVTQYPEATFIETSNTIKALQQLASFYRSKFTLPVIGITGSNGKTIVKEWLFSILSKYIVTHRSPKSYNSQIGVPLSVCMLEPYHRIAIFEAGISQPDEMIHLENIIRPNIGIFTTIGPAHNENFIDIHQKINEKLLLFTKADIIILNSDETDILQAISKHPILRGTTLFCWGKQSNDAIQIIDTLKTQVSTIVTIKFQDEFKQISIPFIDGASIQNTMHCLACLLVLKYDIDEIILSISELTPVAMRLEMHQGLSDCLIINDTYNSDLHSLGIALDFLKQQQQHRKATLILSDMLQTGMDQQTLYTNIASMLEKRRVDKFIGIGKQISIQKACFENCSERFFYKDTNSFLTQHQMTSFKEEAILVKGARVFAFENICKVLHKVSHQTVLEIHLNAIIHNLSVFKSLLAPQTKVMAVVKAFSYGSGSYEIASLLQYYHVDYLAVAYADEGVELKKNGISIPIMVMVPEYSSVDTIIEHHLEPEIYSFESFHWFSSDEESIVNIHLKLDTGMHRLGFQEHELKKLVQLLKQNKHIQIRSIFSHLSSADNPNDDAFTRQQLQTFKRMCSKLKQELNISPLLHLLNSAGISRFTEAQFDMVRLGIGLYGIQPSKGNNLPLHTVATLQSNIIQIKTLKAGERIGYGDACILQSDTTIAVVPIGYADGYRRVLSNGKGIMLVNGQICKVVGNVCMDMTIIDITHIKASVGDTAIIFGEQYSVQEFATSMGVIPYEALSGISKRVKRQYVLE
jgi:alanine racemase